MSKQDKNCQVPTPVQYVEQMLDYVGYKHNLWGRKVLENSCGEGNILVEIVKRYIADARSEQYTSEEIAGGLGKDIVAYEVDQEKIDMCLRRLNDVISSENLPKVKWNVRNQDFLKSDEKNAKFIIGNPPYITYHDLTEEEREFLQGKFSTCKNGRFDYCYAFIEASVNALADNGKMIYLIPFSIFRNRFAAGLRSFLRNSITKIVDYRNMNVFPGITCSPSLIIYENGCKQNEIEYEDQQEQKRIYLERSSLGKNGEKWIFNRTINGNRRFGDYFAIHNSVATLCNEAFLFSAEGEEEECYIVNGMLIEKKVTLPAVSTKSSRAAQKGGRTVRIIFPYKLKKGKVIHYSEEEFKKQYPHAWEYLHQYYNALINRKADKKAKWFEYGRSQALTEVFVKKLVMPMVITNSTKAYIAKRNAIPYAGYFVTVNPDCGMTLEDAKKALESPQFHQYIQEEGTPTTISSYRVSVHDINEFMF